MHRVESATHNANFFLFHEENCSLLIRVSQGKRLFFRHCATQTRTMRVVMGESAVIRQVVAGDSLRRGRLLQQTVRGMASGDRRTSAEVADCLAALDRVIDDLME